ncbi:MAG: hypothetical protein NT007_04360 [Candidatus Kapabacteria bacterium]|nr:hypothetical protein [Candidatus Kapabacteria bacterium]
MRGNDKLFKFVGFFTSSFAEMTELNTYHSPMVELGGGVEEERLYKFYSIFEPFP